MIVSIASGKGGTGKTSVVASLSRGRAVIADCDVDAPDLHLILDPHIREARELHGISRAVIDPARCSGSSVARSTAGMGQSTT